MNEITKPAVLMEGSFDPKLKAYLFSYWALLLAATGVGILLLPIWAVVGTWWARAHYNALGCRLTERTVEVRRGIFLKREMTIPLDKIQDISLREGPLLKSLGLLSLRLETAGYSTTMPGSSAADLVAIVDARRVRDRILEQRDRLAATPAPASGDSREAVLLGEIRDTLIRLEQRLAAGAPAA